MEENKKPAEGSEKPNVFKRIFLDKSFSLRIVSLLCAILLWFYVSAVESPTFEETYESITISLKNKDVMMEQTGMSLISNTVYETNIVLSGKKSVLNKIDYDNIVATVDLSKITEAGDHELEVSIEPIAGTTLVSVTPRNITVSVDKTVAKTFPIETDLKFTTEYSYEDCLITDTQFNPLTEVKISGPAKDVEKISKALVRVDFGNITSSAESRTGLVCLDAMNNEIDTSNLNITPKTVIVKQPIYTTKTLKLTAGQSYNTFGSGQIDISVEPKTIQVKGDPKMLESITEIALDPINEREITNRRLPDKPVLIKLPEGMELIGDITTATVSAYLNKNYVKSITVEEDDITFSKLASNYALTITSIPDELTFINASDKEITIDDIVLSMNLSSYEPGEYVVVITPEFKTEQPYAYFTNENGFWVGIEITEKVGERQ